MKPNIHHAPLLLAGLALAFATPASEAANLLTNGGFESFTGNDPDGWEKVQNIVTTEVAGLDGSGSAVRLGITSGGSNQSAIRQTFSGLSSTFYFQFDFSLLSQGNVPTAGDRIMSFTLRPLGSDPNGTPLITARSLFDGSANNGALQFFDGSAWQSVSGQTELFNQSDAYRITVAGDISGATPSYDVSLFNLTDGTSAGGETGITDFQSPVAGRQIAGLNFERGRAEADYIVDNAYISSVPIPEPSAALLTLAGLAVLSRRRR